MLKPIIEKGLSITNDTKILATAIHYDKYCHPDETVFITNDLALRHIANLFFGEDSIFSIEEYEEDQYSGYKEIVMSEEEMASFYTNQENIYDLLINEYLIIKDESGAIVDKYRWAGNEFLPVKFHTFSSRWFGDIKPMKNDIQQALVADSFENNQITLIKGPAGSGKTILALGFLLHKLETNQIDRIIIFCNTVATRNSARLGYLPGSRNEKLLDSQIGNLLASKFGGKIEVERLIDQEKIILLPLSDIRGYDTSGMRAGIYVSEAQNMDIYLMKLVLQRIGSDSICIIDGDCKTQVDDVNFAGKNNGMRRLSEIFRGHAIYGEIELKTIHRSEIGRIAELM